MSASIDARRRVFGGILWDLFLILVLCAGAFLAWRTRAEWGRWFLSFRGSGRSGAPSVQITPALTDLGRRSAGAQAGIRQFLAESGLREKDILKSYNEERHAEGRSWLESTLEIARPAGFRSGPFLKQLLGFLSRSGLALMRDETEGGRWTLDVGDRDHVFQRLVIHDR